ncbi:tetratricopeptide repeat protein [Marinobacter sp. NFXS11]|uniref:tetratricopeptide repeat protein n=1 Tax=Marinobacter sp. NFXS11 TaxID=2818432 RepID=UPI0032DEAA44
MLAELPRNAPDIRQNTGSAEEAGNHLQRLITQARTSGDPRYLGYAQTLINEWSEEHLTDRLRVLRATLRQSLHQFEPARSDLEQVLTTSSDAEQRIQARLTLANLELVQGRYDVAIKQCKALQADYPGLVAASCLASAEARTANPEQAYASLALALVETSKRQRPDSTSRLWTEGTLGDIAAQAGLPQAQVHWHRVLVATPDDLYIRAQLADWHLAQTNFERVLTLTDGFDTVDTLAVIRAIAMARMGHPDSDGLNDRLRQRFQEARWRGALLHARDAARFLLDVDGQPQEALELAIENWQNQREPLDTRLLLRSSLAANDIAEYQNVRDWLREQGQRDARYPEFEQ